MTPFKNYDPFYCFCECKLINITPSAITRSAADVIVCTLVFTSQVHNIQKGGQQQSDLLTIFQTT